MKHRYHVVGRGWARKAGALPGKEGVITGDARREGRRRDGGRDMVLLGPAMVWPLYRRRELKLSRGQMAERLGMRGLRVHDLRHMVASLLLGHGVSVRVVAELLGHRVPSTTLDVYSHVLRGGSEEAVRLLDRLITQGNLGLEGGT